MLLLLRAAALTKSEADGALQQRVRRSRPRPAPSQTAVAIAVAIAATAAVAVTVVVVGKGGAVAGSALNVELPIEARLVAARATRADLDRLGTKIRYTRIRYYGCARVRVRVRARVRVRV